VEIGADLESVNDRCAVYRALPLRHPRQAEHVIRGGGLLLLNHNRDIPIGRVSNLKLPQPDE
jgi:hypothetical protein